MSRKELMKAIALATGISIAGGAPVRSADLSPGTDDPLIFEPAAGPGPGDGGGGGGFQGY